MTEQIANDQIALKLENISKTFGSVKANQDIDLEVKKGTIHGIIGENGAGKSTLMNIIYGFYHADTGNIYVDGKKVAINNSLEAIDYGIGMVHQHFMLVQPFSVLENIVLGTVNEFTTKNTFDKARATLKELNDNYGLYVDPDAIIEDLPVGNRQRVEILKALYRQARILILDEPTGVLTPQETDKLFEILDALRNEGVTIMLITHKLREIMAITDNVSVMHHGRMVAHRKTSETSTTELAELMVGRKVRLDIDKTEAKPGETLAKMENVSVFDELGVERLKSVNMEIRRGEVVGIAGVSGNGQTELIEALAGMQPINKGRITIMGETIDAKHQISPAKMRDLSIGHIPEDRLKHGIVKQFSAEENSILGFSGSPRWNTKFHMLHGKVRDWCLALMEKWDVRPQNPTLRSADFSGGNQQKLIVGREIEENPDLILIGQPTRGVDIGAIEFIHNSIIQQRDRGCGILLISVELDEVMSIADRILVMFDGKIVGEVKASEADERILGLMMANAYEGEKV
ncbi:MAG: ABC transporter ATP-binding protein [Alphaproteobacteria bacterium]